MNNTISEMKYTLKRIYSRWMKQGIESIIWKTRWQKTPSQSRGKKRNFKNKDCLRDPWDNMKHYNIHAIEIQEEREQG